MLTARASGGASGGAGADKDDIWSYDTLNKVWVTATLTLGAPIYLHAVTVIDSCPTSAGARVDKTYILLFV